MLKQHTNIVSTEPKNSADDAIASKTKIVIQVILGVSSPLSLSILSIFLGENLNSKGTTTVKKNQ